MSALEIEVKSLLGEKTRADELRTKILARGATLAGQGKQLNHYFTGGNITKLAELARTHLPNEKADELRRAANEGKNHSVRTREADGKVLLVVKASLDASTSSNGVARMEFEEEMPMSLVALDKLVGEAGYDYQAKWSREREEYTSGDYTITIDKNAGYGYVAEFERIAPAGSAYDAIAAEVRAFMDELGAEELPQDRLERMFAYYNTHWPEYYGTDKVFTIE